MNMNCYVVLPLDPSKFPHLVILCFSGASKTLVRFKFRFVHLSFRSSVTQPNCNLRFWHFYTICTQFPMYVMITAERSWYIETYFKFSTDLDLSCGFNRLGLLQPGFVVFLHYLHFSTFVIGSTINFLFLFYICIVFINYELFLFIDTL